MIALDTNLLVYVEGLRQAPDDAAKIFAMQALMPRLLPLGVVIPAQVLAELSNVLRRKARLSTAEATTQVARWRRLARVIVPTTEQTIVDALALATRDGLQTFDCLIFAAAAEAGCTTLLSEDIPPGTSWRGCIAANPFIDWSPDRTPVASASQTTLRRRKGRAI